MMTAMIMYVLHCARDAHPLLCFCFVLFCFCLKKTDNGLFESCCN